jgi:hypothetical protein
MLGFSSMPLERHALLEDGVENWMKDDARDVLATLDRVRPVDDDFRLDDWHEALLLAQRGVSRERACVCTRTGRSQQSIGDLKDGPPLREAGTHAAALREAIP